MNYDVFASVALLATMIAPAITIGLFALKRYSRAHCRLVRWRDQAHPAE